MGVGLVCDIFWCSLRLRLDWVWAGLFHFFFGFVGGRSGVVVSNFHLSFSFFCCRLVSEQFMRGVFAHSGLSPLSVALLCQLLLLLPLGTHSSLFVVGLPAVVIGGVL